MDIDLLYKVIERHNINHTEHFLCIGYGRNDHLTKYLGIPYEQIHCDSDSLGPKVAGWHGTMDDILYYIKLSYYNTLINNQTTTMDTTKTFAEANGKKPFNWNEFLKRAINDRGSVTLMECDGAKNRASNWTTCACGNQCEVIPRELSGMPKDKELAELGKEFYDQIKTFQFALAKNTLARIEVVSAELIEVEREKIRQEEAGIKAAKELLEQAGYKITR